jgi:hypothetical protein
VHFCSLVATITASDEQAISRRLYIRSDLHFFSIQATFMHLV